MRETIFAELLGSMSRMLVGSRTAGERRGGSVAAWWHRLVAVCIVCALGATASSAQTFKLLAQFNGTNGAFPEAPLAQGTDGNLYGTSTDGGLSGYGTVFQVTPRGRLTVLHSFAYADGAYPAGGLLLGTDGNFYGTTANGGENNSCNSGCGTIFKITQGGALTTLYTFKSTDGAQPLSELVQATDGNFYGTTAYGGANDSCSAGSFVGCGTVFKITAAGVLTTLHSFGGDDGAQPLAGLIQAADGNFYGTTAAGGANGFCTAGGFIGCGTVFRISASGSLTTLHSFRGDDGANPHGTLVRASNGSLYGSTFDGALNGGGFCAYESCGTIFKITTAGALNSVHLIPGPDGGIPASALIQGNDGQLYGTTAYGGQGEFYGTVFRISPSGVLTTLYTFGGTQTGGNPYGGLLQSTEGVFYGTASSDGAFRDGTAFGESVGLGPFVVTVPTARKVGQKVIILGTNLTGATSVSFNGAAATFKVVSATEITTTVPAGATTGTVQVVTPGGTLNSNVPFWVLP